MSGTETSHNVRVFDDHALQYDAWFDEHMHVYLSEVEAVRKLLPLHGESIDIGAGTGRFSLPFGIKTGVEPSRSMAEIARGRGIAVHEAKAENLPFDDRSYDFVLMVTVICFLEDPLQALHESLRILRPAGTLVIGMLDRDSPQGKIYEKMKDRSTFFRYATFYSAGQVIAWLTRLTFQKIRSVQTLFRPPETISALEPVREGHGEGLFIAISAQKPG